MTTTVIVTDIGLISQAIHYARKIRGRLKSARRVGSQNRVALLRLVFQPGNEAFAAPKLNGAAICKRFGFADCIVVVSAN